MPLEHFLSNASSETASTQALEHPCLMMKNAQAEIFDIPEKSWIYAFIGLRERTESPMAMKLDGRLEKR
jgi:hypothetical protein